MPVDLGRKIRAGQCPEELCKAFHSSSKVQRKTIKLRFNLIPATVVQILAEKTRFLVKDASLIIQVAVSVFIFTIPFSLALESITPIPFLVFLVSAFWHELGHASALVYYGRRPEAIGVGLLLFFPVFWCDVTAVALLSHKQRLRVDISGMIFQLSFGALFHLLAILTQVPAMEIIARLCLMALIWNLVPFLKTDSYWLLCDLLKLDSLWKLPQNADKRTRCLIWSYRVGKILFFGFMISSILYKLIKLVR